MPQLKGCAEAFASGRHTLQLSELKLGVGPAPATPKGSVNSQRYNPDLAIAQMSPRVGANSEPSKAMSTRQVRWRSGVVDPV